MHLLLPLLASVLFVCGLILLKRAAARGIGAFTTLFLTNLFSVLAFTVLWFLGGEIQPLSMLYQPAVIAVLFMVGMLLTFSAIHWGDVSIATPVFGLKVVFVAILLTITGQQVLPGIVWVAVVLASAGIGLIQWTGRDHPRRVVMTILFALSAAGCFATFDILVQKWAPAWGAGRFLPIVIWIVGLLSLAMSPWVDWDKLRDVKSRRFALSGSALVALQSLCIVLTLAMFGDAARVNVVYSMRGLWGVGLAWIVANRWGGGEASLSRGVMLTRFVGAVMLTLAVVFVILSG